MAFFTSIVRFTVFRVLAELTWYAETVAGDEPPMTLGC